MIIERRPARSSGMVGDNRSRFDDVGRQIERAHEELISGEVLADPEAFWAWISRMDRLLFELDRIETEIAKALPKSKSRWVLVAWSMENRSIAHDRLAEARSLAELPRLAFDAASGAVFSARRARRRLISILPRESEWPAAQTGPHDRGPQPG